jgi:hypothetical protein
VLSAWTPGSVGSKAKPYNKLNHTEVSPIYGTGQGSGSSPTLELAISSILFDAYAQKAHGAHYLSPDSLQSASIYMISFVDDSCCQILAPHDGPFDERTLIDRIRHDAQLALHKRS